MESQSKSLYKDLEKCFWFPFSDEPILNPTFYASRFSKPQVVLPSESCDGKWHMFFNSWIGIHHFVSDSGIAWEPAKMVELRGQSPFVFIDGENFCLVYEKHARSIAFSRLSSRNHDRSSRIEMRTSTDFVNWSKPRILLEAKDVSFAGDYIGSPRLFNPQLVKVNGVYRLYFGASFVQMPDCSFKAPRYFSCAVSPDLQGRYVVENEGKILLEALPDDRYSNLACGFVHVIENEGTYFAFQCATGWNEAKKKSTSCILILKSQDGLVWERLSEKPILVTSERGWSDLHITGCDVRYSNSDKTWYCYFSSVGHSGKKGKMAESIGLLLGSVPVPKIESKSANLLSVLSSFFG